MIPHPDTATVILDARHQELLRFAERQRLAKTGIEPVLQTRTSAPGAQLLAALRHLKKRLSRVRAAAPAPLLPLAGGES